MWPKRSLKNSQNHSKILHQGHYKIDELNIVYVIQFLAWMVNCYLWRNHRLSSQYFGIGMDIVLPKFAVTNILKLFQIKKKYCPHAKLRFPIRLLLFFFLVWKLFVFLLSFGFSRILDSMITEKISVFEMHIGCRIIGTINVIIDAI